VLLIIIRCLDFGVFSRIQAIFWIELYFFFWIWTNLGVWFSADMYPMNIQGLSACYIAAVPFLINSLLGTVIGYALLKLSLLIDIFRRKLYNIIHILAKYV